MGRSTRSPSRPTQGKKSRAPASERTAEEAPSAALPIDETLLFRPPAAAPATTTSLGDIQRLERDLWEAADHLRANSGLASSEYFFPVMALIFLRHASNRFDDATEQIEADRASGKMPRRPISPKDYISRRALYLPEKARYDYIMNLPSGVDAATALREAMEAIEESFPPLAGVLHKDFSAFEPDTLEDLLRIFNSETLRHARGDLLGRIYEYFLAEFSKTKAHDDGEFFTPPSLVQTIVNVIEPDHGIVFDPACGSGGMFVQTSHFIEDRLHQDTAKRVTFYGQEKTATTIKLATMNLAVHGLEGNVKNANTFYQDEHTLVGKCDFVMANPPFNVDMVDAAKARQDTRVPFGVPPVSKGKSKGKKKKGSPDSAGGKAKETVGNANFLWINYFWSYLSPKGRAGFVMSSQASSAGRGERDIRQRLVESGDVDVMIAIGPNFFYTRAVPCELWFFDRSKPKERRDTVLMLDARDISRKVSRSVNDFSPEQLDHIAAIVWLYRGQGERFIDLLGRYLRRQAGETIGLDRASRSLSDAAGAYAATLAAFAKPLEAQELPEGFAEAVAAALTAFDEKTAAWDREAASLVKDLQAWSAQWERVREPSLEQLHGARRASDSLASRIRTVTVPAAALAKAAANALAAVTKAAEQCEDDDVNRRAAAKDFKALDAARRAFVEAFERPRYTHAQTAWLLDRFPEGRLVPVVGLVKVVDRSEIQAADWSLTPGRHVGVAPPVEPEGFDFKETMREIRDEIAILDGEAVKLSAQVRARLDAMLA